MSAMPSVSKKPTDRAVVCSTPAVMKKPVAVKKPAAAVKKRPAAALSPASDSEAKPPSVKRTAPSPSLSSSEPPTSHHRHLSIDGFAGAHLESLGSQQAGEVVLEAMGALRRTVRPDRTFSFSVPDPKCAATRRFVLHQSTSPFGTYELEVELEPHHSRR